MRKTRKDRTRKRDKEMQQQTGRGWNSMESSVAIGKSYQGRSEPGYSFPILGSVLSK